MEWKNRVTDLLGCRYPILQGAYHGLGNWAFAAEVTKAGGHGTLTASVSGTPDQLREDIRSCRDAATGAPGSFGVNLTFGFNPDMAEKLEVCIEEGVTVETSANKPDPVAPRIKEAGLKWIHKAARIKEKRTL